MLHNETATGCLSPIARIRKAIDAAGHPALLMVDTISSLASTDYRHDDWGVDVTVGGAQKGLMLPPGMSFNARERQGAGGVEELEADEVVLGVGRHADHEQDRLLPLYAGDPDAAGPRGRDRHAARGRARQRVRPPRPARRGDPRAVRAWGLEILCRDPNYYSPTVTAVLMPEGHDADASAASRSTLQHLLRRELRPLRRQDVPHRPSRRHQRRPIMGALAGTEMALALAGIPHKKGGVQAAMDYLVSVTEPGEGGGGVA